MFEYFYNEIFRSVIIGFGSMFNGIQIKHKDDSDDTVSVIKVPLAYGPTQKFLARLNQNPDLNHPTWGTKWDTYRQSAIYTQVSHHRPSAI